MLFCGRHPFHRNHGPLSLLWSLILAIPFYFLWSRLAPVYLPNLPPLYLHPPLWDCMGVFLVVAILKSLLLG